MAIVYIHKRVSDNKIFYIGIGEEYKRAYDKFSRNRWWTYYTKKYDYEVVITHKDIIWEEACIIEKYLISFYGRRDLKQGSLLNLTDGGEGSHGYITSEESKKKISNSLKGYKRTLEEIEKSRIGRINNKVYEKISRQILQLNVESGKIIKEYSTLTLASKFSKIPRSTLHLTLNKKIKKDGKRYYAGGFDWKYKNT